VENDSVKMKPKTLLTILGISAALCAFSSHTFAADENGTKATARERMFIKKAAMGGMTEVALGKVAAQNGGSQDVKDFGNQMVTDHSKINDNLKEVAGKMGVTIPDSLDSMHQAMVDKMSKLSGAEFDKAYVKDMVKDHEKDIAEFDRAKSMVKNDDLKKFIDDSVPTMKDHLDKIKKFDQAKGTTASQ
jgi:putative membrane protein